MSSDLSDDPKLKPEPSSGVPDAGSSSGPATDEDILRLGSRLEREFALITQKLVDAEESVADIELSVRSIETGSRSRLIAADPGEKSPERITKRLKVVGDGINRIKGWVSKQGDKESAAAGGPGASGGADSRTPGRSGGDLEDRLEGALKAVGADIRDREREVTDLDRRLHVGHKELIQLRTQEQHAREMQLQMGQTKQLSDDLERRMSMLNDMVRNFEGGGKPAAGGAKPSPKDSLPVIPKIEEKLQASVENALKAVEAQEKKVQSLEKDLARGNAALVEERTRQQRIRSMQIELRQVRHLSTDLQRSLSGLGSLVENLRNRAGTLLRPSPASRRGDDGAKARPPSEVAAAKSGASGDSSSS